MRGEGISYHHHGFDDVQPAQSLCRGGGPSEGGDQQRGGEEEGGTDSKIIQSLAAEKKS